jgi:hypothetical protein
MHEGKLSFQPNAQDVEDGQNGLGVWAAEGKTPTSFSEVGALN